MSNEASLIYYLTSFTISVIGFILSRKIKFKGKLGNAFLFFIVSFPIFILQGFRYDVGSDYLSYANISEQLSLGDSLVFSWYKTEPLFMALAVFSYRLFHSKYTYFVLTSIIINYLLFKYQNKIKQLLEIDPARLYAAFYLICFPHFLNIERQGIAVIMVWIAAAELAESKRSKYWIYLIIAILFHNTAILGLVFYLFWWLEQRTKYRLYIKTIIMGLICSPLVFGLFFDVVFIRIPFFSKYFKFLNAYYHDTGFTNVIFFTLIDLLIVSLVIKERKHFKRSTTYIALMLIHTMAYALNRYIDYGFRISFYFENAVLVMYSFLVPQIHNKLTRKLYDLAFLGMFTFYFVFKFYIQGNSGIFPYRFISFEIMEK